MPQNPFDDKSTSVQVMAWCCKAPSHCRSQSWPRSMSPYGVSRPQWVKLISLSHDNFVPPVRHGIFHRPITWNRRDLYQSFACLISKPMGPMTKWQTAPGSHSQDLTKMASILVRVRVSFLNSLVSAILMMRSCFSCFCRTTSTDGRHTWKKTWRSLWILEVVLMEKKNSAETFNSVNWRENGQHFAHVF